MVPPRAARFRPSVDHDPRTRPRLRRVAGIAAALATCLVVPNVVFAQSETPAEQAAREIREARDRANEAAEAFFEAESQINELEVEIGRLEAEEAQLEITVERLREDVVEVAVSRFVTSGSSGISLLTDVDDPQDQIQAEVLTDILTNTGADAIDQYDAAEKALGDKQDEVADRRAEIERSKERFLQLQADAEAEVERLREIEAERLQDEAVQKALEAQVAAERARLEEEARRQAEAAARAQPNPGIETLPTTIPPPTTVPAPDDGDPAGADGAADGDGADAADAAAADTPADGTTETTVETLPPVSTLPEDTGAAGGTSGGRTGETGAGSSPTGGSVGGAYLDGITCPILGSGYADTWGAPRSGGRRHVGVDMIAPRGVPILAVTNGVVTFKQNRLGGNAVSLMGDNGNRYYYAHLDRYEGASRYVQAGEVIGYNGDTGNAQYSTPHLHFQIHPGNGQPVNPYPTMRAMGC